MESHNHNNQSNTNTNTNTNNPNETQNENENENLPITTTEFIEPNYSSADFQQPLEENEMPHEWARLHYSFGWESHKRYNLHYLNNHTLFYASGNIAVLLDLVTFEQTYIPPPLNGVGIGAVAIHPSHDYIAIATKGNSPYIFIYTYPQLTIYRVLRGGTTKMYTDICFSNSGEKMASVGGYPDFLLTLWEWEKEKILLRTKAFSQEIFKITFSPDNEGHLFSSGTGHIRFWKMADTFTGLKLQGELGKFGKSELSDIAAYACLPDGKVLSGTETGIFLLWEGTIIKCEIWRTGHLPCHNGMIEVIKLDGKELVSAGMDGKIKFWDLDIVDNADIDASRDSKSFEMEPIREILLVESIPQNISLMKSKNDQNNNGDQYYSVNSVNNNNIVQIKEMIKSPDQKHWLIQDAAGGLWKMDITQTIVPFSPHVLESLTPQILSTSPSLQNQQQTLSQNTIEPRSRSSTINSQSMTPVTPLSPHTPHSPPVPEIITTYETPVKIHSFHSGIVTSIDASPNRYLAVTTGSDNTVRLYDFHNRKFLYSNRFASGGSIVLWVPLNVDPSSRSVIVGFVDGTVRVLIRCKDYFKISHVFKPHTSKVNSIIYSLDGSLLITASDDCTVFFLSAKNNYEPLGFFKTDSPINSLSIEGSFNQALLAFCKNGKILELDIPKYWNQLDVSVSYDITQHIKFHEFWPKIEVPYTSVHTEDPHTSSTTNNSNSNSNNSNSNNNDANNNTPAPPVPLFVDPGPLQILTGFYTGNGKEFYLTLDTPGTDYIYSFTINKEIEISTPKFRIETQKSAVRTLFISKKGYYAIYGADDGSIRVSPSPLHPLTTLKLVKPNTPTTQNNTTTQNNGNNNNQNVQNGNQSNNSNQSNNNQTPTPDYQYLNTTTYVLPYWQGRLHDGLHGKILKVTSSYDDSYIMSVGEDGNFYVLKVSERASLGKGSHSFLEETNEEKEDLTDHIENEVKDILDEKHYSIQEAKLRDEEDKLAKEAEEKKVGITHRIEALRKVFQNILRDNEKIYPIDQLSREDLIIDPYLLQSMENETQKKIEEARQELHAISALKKKQLDMLKKRYIESIQTEKIVLKAFRTQHTVATFPLCYMSASLIKKLNEMYERIKREQEETEAEENRRKVKETLLLLKNTDESKSLTDFNNESNYQNGNNNGKTDINSKSWGMGRSLVEKAEEQKRRRQHREKEWQHYYEMKPDDRKEDPADLDRIRQAKKNKGNYPLKMDKDYKVPEHLRINAEKKRRQKLMLQESIYKVKGKFNEQVLQLRESKMSILETISRYYTRIAEINKALDIEENLQVPVLTREEAPHVRLDFDKATLKKFKKEQELIKKREEKERRRGGISGGLMDLLDRGNNTERELENDDLSDSDSSTTASVNSVRSFIDSSTPTPKRLVPSSAQRGKPVSSRAEPTMETVERQKVLTGLYEEKVFLISQINVLVDSFDEKLNQLRFDRVRLVGELKMAEMKLILLRKELVLLKEFEKQDIALASKLKAKRAERDEFISRFEEIQERVSSKNKESEKINESMRDIEAEFRVLVPETNAHFEALTKIFEKQTRKSKKGKFSDEKENYATNDESDDLDDDLDFDDDIDEQDLDVCPTGCDKNLFAQVLQLRTKKQELEDVKTEVKKSIEQLRKDLDGVAKRDKIVDAALKAAENEIQAFQNEKQQRLNELHTVLTLHLHQIQCVVAGSFPSDLTECLVFTNNGMDRLNHRVGELRAEISDLRTQLKTLRKECTTLKKDKELKKIKNKELDAKCNEVQLLKFGQPINIEALERMSVNKTAEELKERLHIEENEHIRELEALDVTIRKLRKTLTNATEDNTTTLKQMADVYLDQYTLEENLIQTQNAIFAETSRMKKHEVLDERELKGVMTEQQQRIELLKLEISFLRNKSGSIHSNENVF